MIISPLALFDRLVPKDVGTSRIATGLAYGPNPRQRLDLYAPSRPTGPLPLLVFVYGGGWNAGTRDEYRFAGRAFAGLGFLTAVPDYRVFPEVEFPGFVDDLGRAANWLAAHAGAHGGDPARLVLAGHSAGAYNAVMLALDPGRFGARELAGRFAGVVGLSGPYDFYPFDVKESIDAFGRTAEPERTQPVNLVTAAAPPMLLAHGEKDRKVGDYHTVRLARRLRDLGVPVVEKHYPTLSHAETVLGLARPLRQLLPVWRDVSAFLSPFGTRRSAP